MFVNAWRQFQRWIQRSETLGPVGLAIVVGLLSGLAAISLRYLIAWAHWLFFDFAAGIPALVGLVDLVIERPIWSVQPSSCFFICTKNLSRMSANPS